MKNVLIVSGHTDLNNDSVANKTIIDEIKRHLPEVEVDYLDQLYPDFNINVEAEQAKLIKADIVVFQYPMFWYSMPSILERWMEKTFVRGWSHGSKGKNLQGKKLIVSLTSGTPEDAFKKDGSMGYDVDALLLPAIFTAKLCGMDYVGYFYLGGVSYSTRNDETALADMKRRAKAQAERIVQKIKSL